MKRTDLGEIFEQTIGVQSQSFHIFSSREPNIAGTTLGGKPISTPKNYLRGASSRPSVQNTIRIRIKNKENESLDNFWSDVDFHNPFRLMKAL